MKKLLLLILIPAISIAQDSTRKVKFQYIDTKTTIEQTDTIAGVLRNALDIIPHANSALRIYSNSSRVETVYEEKKDTVTNKTNHK